MDDIAPPTAKETASRLPLGMSSFGPQERQKFGQTLRLAMACIEGTAEPVDNNSMPSDVQTIRQRLKALSQGMTSHHADLLELLVRFDELDGYKTSGANHCAAWMNIEIGISLKLGWEYLRVGRKLRLLPTTTALFKAGKLSWSKIRVLVNVANAENENTLCHAAIDASVTDVVRICNEFRWNEDEQDAAENEQALKRWESRSLTWDEVSYGSTRIQLILPPEIARGFLNSVEHSLNQLDDSEDKYTQRRADAAVLMAETSLNAAGREVSTADRYQVIVSVDASHLAKTAKDDMHKNNNANAESNQANKVENISDNAESNHANSMESTSNDTVSNQANSIEKTSNNTGSNHANSIEKTSNNTGSNQANSIEKTSNNTGSNQANSIEKTSNNTDSNHANSMESTSNDTVSIQANSIEKISNNASANDEKISEIDSNGKTLNNNIPAKRPTVRGASAIARETARRIACDCSVTINTTTDSEPTSIGRKSRLWPPAMARAIKERDQHCQFYGCNQTHNLQIHHIIHWADGGSTCLSNGACLCQHHHTMVHEGGYTIQNVDSDIHHLNEQFEQQRHAGDTDLSIIEKTLRNDQDSYNKVRKLSPTRYRFRIIDREGVDIRYKEDVAWDKNESESDADYTSRPIHSTRVECSEPAPNPYNYSVNNELPNLESHHTLCSQKPIYSTHVECSEPAPNSYDYSVNNELPNLESHHTLCSRKPIYSTHVEGREPASDSYDCRVNNELPKLGNHRTLCSRKPLHTYGAQRICS